MKPSREVAEMPAGEPESADDRLMAGEDPATILARDAVHWIAIYREMIGFKIDVLIRVGVGLSGVSDEARIELTEDVDLIEAQLGRYERRLKFWLNRVDTLSPRNGSRVPRKQTAQVPRA